MDLILKKFSKKVEMEPYTFDPKPQKIKEVHPRQISYIFSKESCSYVLIFQEEAPKRLFIFQEVTCKA